MAAGFPMAPRLYAANYYLHLPYFGIGYWPPLFYVAEGLWMKAVGYSRSEILLFVAFIAALIAATIFVVTRSRIGATGAFLCAVLFLLLPDVLSANSMVMTDTMVALFSFWSVLALARYFESGGYRYAILFGVLASCTIMTKYSGGFLVLVPPLGLLIGRRWDLLRRGSFWVQPIVVAALCGPWVIYAKQFASLGFTSYVKLGFGSALLQYLHLEFGFWMSVLLFGAWIYQAMFLAKADALSLILWVSPLSVLLFQSLAPIGIETRYLIPALAPLIVLLAFALARLPKRYGLAALVVTVIACSVVPFSDSRRPANSVRSVVESIIRNNGSANRSLVYVPADKEGPMIAEFAMRDAERPVRILARTNKLLAHMDWLGNQYRSYYQRPSDLEQFFLENPPDLVILHPRSQAAGQLPHERLLETAIHDYPACWKMLESTAGYDIYEFTCSSNARGAITSLFRRRMTGWMEDQ
jgi:hypothetical protein